MKIILKLVLVLVVLLLVAVFAVLFYLDAIAKGEPPRNPDQMITVRVLADVQ